MGGSAIVRDSLQSRPLNMWLLTAVIPPVLSVAGRNGWLGVLPAALMCGGLSAAVQMYGCRKLPRWICVLELGWLIVIAGMIAGESATCWKGDNIAVPIILIILAAFASCRGSINASRIGATLSWLVLPILGVVAFAGSTDINPEWISTKFDTPDGLLIVFLLVPSLTALLPGAQERKGRLLPWLLGVTAVLSAALLEGTLGKYIAGNGFYQFSKGISLFGVAERFEALVACALTLGWFTLFSLIFSTAYHLFEEIYPKAAGWGIWVCATAAAGVMCILPKNRDWVAVGTLIFWGFMPLITQGLVGRKKVVKK